MSLVQSLLRRAIGLVRRKPSALERWKALQATIKAPDADRDIADRVRMHTMSGPFRVHALLDAVGYVVARDIPGAFVECGVWRGGSVLAMLLKLQQLGVTDRDVYLYDTFEGMTTPTAEDTSAFEPPAAQTFGQAASEGKRGWDHLFNETMFTEQIVRDTLLASGYPAARLHFIKGPVEQTLPGTIPERIALLRLDTDWYESTRHELEHLYPRLSAAGVLLIDDYGHWEGCRKAVEEYFAPGRAQRPLFARIDYSACIAIKA
ncbi:MAG TPA: TylF/MycF/NovP-related O-methyltransferase [Solimonas sp.]|nr:TylF/MycF/NovP-related O-methyltransferase [Solimonas sp.]